MKFNKTKFKALHIGQRNLNHKFRLGNEQIGSSTEKKDLVLVDEKLSMSLVCACSTENQVNQVYFGLHQKKGKR